MDVELKSAYVMVECSSMQLAAQLEIVYTNWYDLPFLIFECERLSQTRVCLHIQFDPATEPSVVFDKLKSLLSDFGTYELGMSKQSASERLENSLQSRPSQIIRRPVQVQMRRCLVLPVKWSGEIWPVTMALCVSTSVCVMLIWEQNDDEAGPLLQQMFDLLNDVGLADRTARAIMRQMSLFLKNLKDE